MAFAINSEVHGCHIYKDFWSAAHGISLSKVCNREDRYAISHACSHALKSSRDAVNFLWELIFVERQLPGIYF